MAATLGLLVPALGQGLVHGSPASPPKRELSDPVNETGRPIRYGVQPAAATNLVGPEKEATAEDLQIIPPARRIMTPPLPADLEWVRSAPISLEMLKGRVVLIDVWESSCINCVRSLPAVSRLQALYGRDRFIVIGIHSPEYGFNANRAAVERATRRFGLEFPVASDHRKTFWNSWRVGGWPTTFLLDTHGRLAHLHQGEFPSREMELRVRRLILEDWPNTRFPEPSTLPPDRNPYAPECGFVTPEIPTRPGLDFLLNREGIRKGETILYADPGQARSEGTFFLRGPWAWLSNGLQRGAGMTPAAVGITYTAKEVYAVLALMGQGEVEIEVLQDGRPLCNANRGEDVQILPDGRSVIVLKESRLHYLVTNPDVGRHDLELIPPTQGFLIHSFSFGNRCQTDFPHK